MGDITDNTLPGARPDKMTSPIVIWIASILAGPILGSIWIYRNARHLGCRDLKQQGVVLGAGAVICAGLFSLIDLIKDNIAPDSLAELGNNILFNAAILGFIVVTGYCYNRQTRLFALHANETGVAPMRLMTAGLFVLGSWVVTILLLATVPPMGEAMGGIALILS